MARKYTPKNCLLHFYSKACKARNSNLIYQMMNVRSEASQFMDVTSCDFCTHDDFDLCDLRGTNIQEAELFLICFDAWIKKMKIALENNDFTALYLK